VGEFSRHEEFPVSTISASRVDTPACVAALKNAGVTFRNEMEVGPGGRQIQIEDPDGNPLELFEPASRA
jgi:hypothetical protein